MLNYLDNMTFCEFLIISGFIILLGFLIQNIIEDVQ
jgi:hypothetical protein